MAEDGELEMVRRRGRKSKREKDEGVRPGEGEKEGRREGQKGKGDMYQLNT